jgi:hypothetical protein
MAEKLKLPTYEVTITGTRPLIMHRDDIEWADHMDSWKANKDNVKKSKAGDDRSPSFRWIGSVYRTDDPEPLVSIPGENIMRALMEGAAMVPVPGSKSGKTFKSQSQSGIMMQGGLGWPLMLNGRAVPFAPIQALVVEADFKVHQAEVQKMGFRLFLKRAKIGASKHVRVRPIFDGWSAKGLVAISDEQITEGVLNDILEMAGRYKGLCDWRPGSKTPGQYGMFEAEVRRV